MKKVFFNIIVATLALSLGFYGCKKDEKEFTVVFNSNGGSEVPSQPIKDGEKATKPTPDPTKDDNTFGGWFKDNNTFAVEWNFAANVVTENTTLYAKWNVIPPAPIIAVSATGLDDLKVGEAASNASIVFTLANGEFAATITAANFAVSGLPAGLSAGTATRTSATVVTLAISGTPTTAIVSPITLTLPASIPAANVTGATSAVAVTGAVTLTVAKGNGAAVSGAPTPKTVTENSIEVNAVTTAGGQEVEYAINTTTDEPTDGWEVDKTTFDGLEMKTVYYVWARSKANDNYNAGVAWRSTAITTEVSETDKEVEAKYRFEQGPWSDFTAGGTIGGVAKLTANTFTVTVGSDVIISYSDVFTDGGGSFTAAVWGNDASWAYLYDGASKIGIVAINDDGSCISVQLGKSMNEWLGDNIDADDMQDTHNGYVVLWFN